MTKTKLFKLLAILLSSSLLEGCISAPPDVPVCVNLVSFGHCINTISDKESDIVGDAWNDLLKKSLVLPSDSWAEIKKYILDMCKQNNNCQQMQVEKKIEKLEIRVE